MKIEEFEKGNTVLVKTTFSDDTDTVVAPDNEEASIEIKDLDLQEIIVSETSMTSLSSTQYIYKWDTTEGMTEGEYEVETSAEISNNDVLNRDRVRLENIITEGLVEEFEKGNTVHITTTFSDTSGTVVTPDNKDVEIKITDLSTGSIEVASTQMTDISDTQFQYNWATSEGMSDGEYEIRASAQISGDDVVNKDRIRLTDIIVSDDENC